MISPPAKETDIALVSIVFETVTAIFMVAHLNGVSRKLLPQPIRMMRDLSLFALMLKRDSRF